MALSLVGEPVMYPRMADFLRVMHSPPYSMSTFLGIISGRVTVYDDDDSY